MRFLARAALLASSLLAVACAPEIGDACTTSADCSVQGDRICDFASPGGYCTVANCEEDTCPEGAVCVAFRPEPERLQRTYCMAPCGDSADCRMDEGYRCVRATELLDEGSDEPLARVLDEAGDATRFCVADPSD